MSKRNNSETDHPRFLSLIVMMRRLNHFTDLGAFWGSKPERFLEELQVQNHKPTDSTGKPQTTLEEGQKKSTETPPPISLKTKDMERTKKRPPVSPSQSDPKENFLEQIQRGVPLKKVKVEETPKKPSDSTAFKNMITHRMLDTGPGPDADWGD